MPNLRLTVLLAIVFLAILFISPALGANESKQISLSIYVDNGSTNALVVGYMDNPEGLPFLNASERIYEKDTGMLYDVTGSLVKPDGGSWNLKFPLKGYYDEYHVVFYIPGMVELKEMDCSQGLEFLASRYNNSLIINVQGFDVSNPEVAISYQEPEKD